jgi:hypothetical protein
MHSCAHSQSQRSSSGCPLMRRCWFLQVSGTASDNVHFVTRIQGLLKFQAAGPIAVTSAVWFLVLMAVIRMTSSSHVPQAALDMNLTTNNHALNCDDPGSCLKFSRLMHIRCNASCSRIWKPINWQNIALSSSIRVLCDAGHKHTIHEHKGLATRYEGAAKKVNFQTRASSTSQALRAVSNTLKDSMIRSDSLPSHHRWLCLSFSTAELLSYKSSQNENSKDLKL